MCGESRMHGAKRGKRRRLLQNLTYRNVAKVEIDRAWFDPGVFMLTADMYNTSSEHIAPEDETSFHDSNKQAVLNRMKKMNNSVFPCYPTAFVIAKDVTIKFVSQQSI